MKSMKLDNLFVKSMNLAQPSDRIVNFHDAQNGWILTSILLERLKQRKGD